MITSNDDRQIEQSASFGATIDIELKSPNGVSLLGSNQYPIANIVAKYSLSNLQHKESNDAPILDYPNNVSFNSENKSIKIFLNHSSSEKFPLTYIHWNKTDIDTIKAQYRRSENSVILDKVWIFKNNTWEELKSKPLIIIK
ncbi:hypothetical protein [Flavobacterium pectinovorum]|uniref:Uncharacterized protein n=1 Tax=Flavobacterium pectinovorum TaxID=29533 RepID=A0A502EMA5_9FLAO|nr:hypothetical protein [Flavobacterium pectinovorum]TPG38868.1 hypothetical protein EAH81_15435 [Flavobacterium pectinovorum]